MIFDHTHRRGRGRRFAAPVCVWLCVLLLVGCQTGAPASSGAPGASQDETTRRFLLHETLYEIPKGWRTEQVRGPANYHYPPDGGMLYVSPASYGLGDLNLEDEACDGLYYSGALLAKSMPDFEQLETEERMHKGHYALDFWFNTTLEGHAARGRAFFYADAREKEIYQYVFVLPDFSGSEIEEAMEDIIAGIR